jgi:hypothetical protein
MAGFLPENAIDVRHAHARTAKIDPELEKRSIATFGWRWRRSISRR